MNVQCDEFVVMPNHIHGIIFINNCRGEVSSPFSEVVAPNSKTKNAPIQGGETPPLRKITLGQIVGIFQISVGKTNQSNPQYPRHARLAAELLRTCHTDDKELKQIREYIGTIQCNGNWRRKIHKI